MTRLLQRLRTIGILAAGAFSAALIVSVPNRVGSAPLLADLRASEAEGVEQTLFVAPGGSDADSGSRRDKPLRTIQKAIDAAAGKNTRIVLADGSYREYVAVGAGTNLLIVQAQNIGKAVISGSDVFTGWQKSGQRYMHEWPNNWGVGPTGFFGIDFNVHILERRRENIWINGARMQQVLSLAELGPGKFHVVDNTANNGRLTLVPPVNTDMATARIEVAVRGAFPAGGHYSDGKSLFAVKDHSNFQIKGLVFQHSANYWNASPALSIQGSSRDPKNFPTDILVEDCVMTQNNSVGFGAGFVTNLIARRVRCNDNGERGAGSSVFRNWRFEDCEFSRNNWRFGAIMYGHDAAGYKTFEGGYFGVPYLSTGLTFARCKFVDNNCLGFWCDYGGRDFTFERCLFAGNQHGGIMSEMTHGPLTIKNSLLKNNRGAAIMAYNAQNISIENCVLYGSYKGPMWGEDAALLCFHSDLRNDEGGKDTVETDEPDTFTGFHISGSTLIANRPDSELFLEGKEATSRFAKQTFVSTVKSGKNRWFRRKGANDPADGKAFFSTMLFNNYLDNYPDITFRQWQMLTGQDADSIYADVPDAELDASPVLTKPSP